MGNRDKQPTPFFSIIIPLYNAEKTIGHCLDSIAKQSYCAYEVLLINDGSTDKSTDILSDYSAIDNRLKVFEQKNQGPSAARNKGLDNAVGKWILFVDADDYLRSESALSTLYKTICNNAKLELVYFAGEVVLPSGKWSDKYIPRLYKTGYECLEENCNNNKCIVFGALYVQCYMRSLIEKHKIRFAEDIVYGEDRLFVCQYFLLACRTIVLDDVLYSYVITENSLMRDKAKSHRVAKDNREVALRIEQTMKHYKYTSPQLQKYIHGLYLSGASALNKRDYNWRFIFRNASTWKLKIKDILLFLGLYRY
ncbi:MAG: glycosyltransferase [Paludibacteraceae bacterium]|nr:glycosyltransferase [Paludibacteraceae bacterium]